MTELMPPPSVVSHASSADGNSTIFPGPPPVTISPVTTSPMAMTAPPSPVTISPVTAATTSPIMQPQPVKKVPPIITPKPIPKPTGVSVSTPSIEKPTHTYLDTCSSWLKRTASIPHNWLLEKVRDQIEYTKSNPYSATKETLTNAINAIFVYQGTEMLWRALSTPDTQSTAGSLMEELWANKFTSLGLARMGLIGAGIGYDMSLDAFKSAQATTSRMVNAMWSTDGKGSSTVGAVGQAYNKGRLL